ncbi:MAG: nucleotidyltransferase, partial [Acidimicrobiia bacterium]
MSSWEPDAALVATLKSAAAALRDAGVPFAVGGGFAAWARGAPPTEHDVDLFVCRSDVDAALDALAGVGMRPERPPEGWLVKAWDGDVLVDVIFAPSGFDVTPSVLARSEVLNVAGMELPVLPAGDIFVSRLLAFHEHHL